jgi:hypothetical protein
MLTFMQSSQSRFFILLSFFFFISPLWANAASQLLISEIQYNPVGTDDKHEYIEVCNAGADSVDMVGYKLYESSSNHALTLRRGSSTLGKDACAVLVTDPATFMLDYPSFSATLFEASFALVNTGEPLVLRDVGGADVDGVAYASSQGGNGDGKTLHRAGTVFVGGSASPGCETGLVGTSTGSTGGTAGTTDTNTTPADTTTPPTSVTTIFHTVTIEPPAQLFVRTVPTITTATGSVVTFTAEAYNAKGSNEDAQFTWVYGDGMRDGQLNTSNKSVTHIYKHSGEYEAVVTASKMGLTGEARVRVVVTDSPLKIQLTEEDSVVEIINTGAVPVDLTGVRLVNGSSQTYTIPDKTRVLPKSRLALALVDIGLTDRRMPREVTLMYADGSKKLSVTGTVTPSYAPSPIAINKPNEPMTLLGFGKAVSLAVAGQNLSSTSTAAVVASADSVAAVPIASVVPEVKKVPLRAVAQRAPSPTLSKKEIHGEVPVVTPETPIDSNPQTAAGVQSMSSIPTWLLLIVGSMLLSTGVFASWVIGKNPS